MMLFKPLKTANAALEVPEVFNDKTKLVELKGDVVIEKYSSLQSINKSLITKIKTEQICFEPR